MLKKTLAAAGLAGLLVLGGAAAASADPYPPVANVTVSDTTPVPGQPITITATGIPSIHEQVTFVVSGPDGATLASLVATAAAGSSSVTKPVSNNTATATLTPAAPGDHVVTVLAPDGTVLGTIAVTVAAAGGGAGGGTGAGGSDAGAGGLPNTGGAFPATALWLGLGAVGMGGIAIAAGVARRRASSH